MSLREVLFDRKYRSGTHIVFMLMSLMMWTGIDALNMFSNRILTKINGEQEVAISANTATVIFGYVSLIASFFAFPVVKSFGRVPIMFWAHIVLGIIHCLVGICIIYN